MDTNWQTWEQSPGPAAFSRFEESKLKLSLETRNRGDVIIVHCHGRIVYRNEAASLSRVVNEILRHNQKIVLELSGVSSMDSAGIGELASLHSCAAQQDASLKCAGPNAVVRTLLELTNLESVLDVYSSLGEALESFREERVCADC